MSGHNHNQADPPTTVAERAALLDGRIPITRPSTPPYVVNQPNRVQVWQVLPVDSCNVSLELNSQWRNGEHWHAVWPEGTHWCFETQAEASERVAECQRLRGEVAS